MFFIGTHGVELSEHWFDVPMFFAFSFSFLMLVAQLDMVAIPEFAMGAMENWGLVTYREVDLLIDVEKASSQQKQRCVFFERVEGVIAPPAWTGCVFPLMS